MNIITGGEVDVDEPTAISACMDLEQPIAGFIEALDAIKLGGFDETPLRIVGPSVIAAS